jgi:regulatory protein YycI of two-component signal transduction system YycFG
MRNLFIIALLILGAFLAGWFTVNRDGERTTIEINKSEIRQDTKQVIERGKEFLHERADGEQAAHGV